MVATSSLILRDFVGIPIKYQSVSLRLVLALMLCVYNSETNDLTLSHLIDYGKLSRPSSNRSISQWGLAEAPTRLLCVKRRCEYQACEGIMPLEGLYGDIL